MPIPFYGPPETWQAEHDIIHAQALRDGDLEKLRDCREAQEDIDLLSQPSVLLRHGTSRS